MDPISIATAIQMSIQAISLCNEYYSGVKTARADIERLTSEIQLLQRVLESLEKLVGAPSASKLLTTSILEDVKQCSAELRDLESQLKPGIDQKRMRRFGFRALKWPFSKKDVDAIVVALERHKASLNTALGVDQTSMALSAEQDRSLAKLALVEGATFNSYRLEHEPQCLEDTRVDLLDEVLSWRTESHQQHIFWLSGMAGTGKSTIARTVAHKFADQKCLGASFFFSRGGGDLCRAAKFFNTIAIQLARTSPVLKSHICETMAEHEDISQQFISKQWKHLIFEPIKKLETEQSPALDTAIVIDALDECENENDVRTILQLLSQVKEFKRNRIRIFITSRPETPIRLGFESMDEILHQSLVLQNDVPQSTIEHDISLFLRHELNQIVNERKLPIDWPGEREFQLLVQKSGTLFIYAATACRFIAGKHSIPRERLALLLEENPSKHSSTKELDHLYMEVLKNCIDQDEEDIEREVQQKRFRDVVGSIVILYDALSALSLASFLSMEIERVDVILGSLHSVLNISRSEDIPIRLLHPSFRDFLLNKERCSNEAFFVDEELTHRNLVNRCLIIMSESLKRDICDLKDPGILVSEISPSKIAECLPPHVQYACLYWVSHLQKAGPTFWSEIESQEHVSVLSFFQNHFLIWLEALSLLGEISTGVNQMLSLRDIVQSQRDLNHLLAVTINDAWLFLRNCRAAVEIAPLQIYCSALIFSPTTSLTRQNYKNHIPRWVTVVTPIEDTWNNTLRHTIDDSSFSGGVALSSDNNFLASGSTENVVKIWNVGTGTLIAMFDGPGTAYSIAFSHDSRFLAATFEFSIWIWDLFTRTVIHKLKCHRDTVNSVVFSVNGKLLASWSFFINPPSYEHEGGFQILDANLGTVLHSLYTKSEGFNVVVFSPNSALLACAQTTGNLQIRDATTGKIIHTLKRGITPCRNAVFSLDSTTVASQTRDEISIWDVTRGTLIWTKAYNGDFTLFRLLHSGRFVGWTTTKNNDIAILDLITETNFYTIAGYSSHTAFVILSESCPLAVSATYQGTIKIWDVKLGESPDHKLESHSDKISGLVFSHDGALVVSASWDTTLRIWSTVKGNSLNTFVGHSHIVESLDISTDDKLLASASLDRSIMIWDVKAGILLHDLKGHQAMVNSVTFSHNCKLMASGSTDTTVMIWDTTDGSPIDTLRGHTGSVNAVKFSQDDKMIASSSIEKTVKIWDASTGFCLQTIDNKPRIVQSMSFSDNGKLIALGSLYFGLELLEVSIWSLEERKFVHMADQLLPVTRSSIDSIVTQSIRGWRANELSSLARILQIDGSRRWLTEDGNKILWLPESVRPVEEAVRGNIVVLGNVSGRITILRVDKDIISSSLPLRDKE